MVPIVNVPMLLATLLMNCFALDITGISGKSNIAFYGSNRETQTHITLNVYTPSTFTGLVVLMPVNLSGHSLRSYSGWSGLKCYKQTFSLNGLTELNRKGQRVVNSCFRSGFPSYTQPVADIEISCN